MNNGLRIAFKAMKNYDLFYSKESEMYIDRCIENVHQKNLSKQHSSKIPKMTRDQYVNEFIIDQCGCGLKVRALDKTDRTDYMLYFNKKEFRDKKHVVDDKYDFNIPLPFMI